MEWLINLFTNTESVAHIALLYAIVIAVGVYLGKIKVGGISLQVSWQDTLALRPLPQSLPSYKTSDSFFSCS